MTSAFRFRRAPSLSEYHPVLFSFCSSFIPFSFRRRSLFVPASLRLCFLFVPPSFPLSTGVVPFLFQLRSRSLPTWFPSCFPLVPVSSLLRRHFLVKGNGNKAETDGTSVLPAAFPIFQIASTPALFGSFPHFRIAWPPAYSCYFLHRRYLRFLRTKPWMSRHSYAHIPNAHCLSSIPFLALVLRFYLYLRALVILYCTYLLTVMCRLRRGQTYFA